VIPEEKAAEDQPTTAKEEQLAGEKKKGGTGRLAGLAVLASTSWRADDEAERGLQLKLGLASRKLIGLKWPQPLSTSLICPSDWLNFHKHNPLHGSSSLGET
jgi:hypothetical protein